MGKGFAWHSARPTMCVGPCVRANHGETSVYNKRHLVTMIILP